MDKLPRKRVTDGQLLWVKKPGSARPEPMHVYTEDAAFRRLTALEANQRNYLRWLARRWVSEDEEEDVIQFSLLKAYKHLATYSFSVLHMPWGLMWIKAKHITKQNGEQILSDWFHGKAEHLRVEEIRHPAAWLHQIVTNEARNYLTKKKLYQVFCEKLLEGSLEEDFYFDGPEMSVVEAEQTNELRSYVYALPKVYREVVLLHYFKEMSLHDIASQVGRSYDTVKSQERRARSKLKKIYQEHGIKDLKGVNYV